MLKNGWYILNYHEISWEENPWIAGIGGSFPPDLFRAHLATLSRAARLVSVQEGFRRFREGRVDEPLVSFWFDDGFAGVRRYAMPLMQEYDVSGAISVNSRFTLRQEMFWRAKLSYLSHTDGLRVLRSRLKPFGYTLDRPVKTFTMDRFSLEMIRIIDEVYEKYTREIDRRDAFRLFDTMEGIRTLHENGWEIANHSSAHYPVSEASHIDRFADDFLECEEALERHLGLKTDFWVLPFDRKSLAEEELLARFRRADDSGRHLVLVGNRVNESYDPSRPILYRLEPPYLRDRDLLKYMASFAE